METNEKELLTVAEVAEALGITKQAVYQKLSKSWSSLVQEVDGQKMISSEVLQAEKARGSAETKTETSPCLNVESIVEQALEQELNKRLKEENQRLNEEIHEKDALIKAYAEKFAALAEREQEIAAKALVAASQAQALHALSVTESASETSASEVSGTDAQNEPETIDDAPAKRRFRFPWTKK